MKDRFFYAIKPTVLFQVKYTDKNRRKQTAISRLRFGKCLLNDVLDLFGMNQGSVMFVGSEKMLSIS